jgi:hypothetical protein
VIEKREPPFPVGANAVRPKRVDRRGVVEEARSQAVAGAADQDVARQADVDDSDLGVVAQDPVEACNDLPRGRAAVPVCDLHDHERRVGGDPDRRALPVAGDQPGDLRAVALVVERAPGAALLARAVGTAVGRDEAVLVDDRVGEVGIALVDARVEHGDGDALAGEPGRPRGVASIR